MKRIATAMACGLLAGACASTPVPPPAPVDLDALTRQVHAAETAFARTMADRDHAAFASFLAEDAIFVNGSLAQTKGPVHSPDGELIAEFRSTWRQESPGVWKIVFDDGACACPPKPQP